MSEDGHVPDLELSSLVQKGRETCLRLGDMFALPGSKRKKVSDAVPSRVNSEQSDQSTPNLMLDSSNASVSETSAPDGVCVQKVSRETVRQCLMK